MSVHSSALFALASGIWITAARGINFKSAAVPAWRSGETRRPNTPLSTGRSGSKRNQRRCSRNPRFESGCGLCGRYQIQSDAQQSRPEPAVNPVGYITRTAHTPATAIALAMVTCRHRGDAKNLGSALPTHSRGPRLVMTSRGETSAALEAATDRIRWSCIGPLAQGCFPARLLPREAFRSAA